MVNPGHLAKLKESVEVWNTWRYENPAITPALWGANLRGADLRGANLLGADFGNADLKRADFTGANLMGVIYLEADQLCETKTLYQARMDPDIEREVMRERSVLFENPGDRLNKPLEP